MPAPTKGGLLGRVSPSTLRPELRNALQGLGVGQISPVVRIATGFAILKVVADADAGDAPAGTSESGAGGDRQREVRARRLGDGRGARGDEPVASSLRLERRSARALRHAAAVDRRGPIVARARRVAGVRRRSDPEPLPAGTDLRLPGKDGPLDRRVSEGAGNGAGQGAVHDPDARGNARHRVSPSRRIRERRLPASRRSLPALARGHARAREDRRRRESRGAFPPLPGGEAGRPRGEVAAEPRLHVGRRIPGQGAARCI